MTTHIPHVRTLSTALGVVLLGALLGCSSTDTSTTSDAVELDFWYSVSGVPATTLGTLVDEFNEDHAGEIVVKPLFQGSYDESISKLTNAVQAGDLPVLIQGGDTFSTYLKDTGLTAPPGSVTNSEGKKYSGTDLVPIIKNYYTFDGELSSYPIMVSQPAVIYNTELLTQAGIDPANAPTSITELLSLAAQIHSSSGTAGLTMFTDPWWAEQFSAAAGLEYCTPENGVGAEPAEKFNYASDTQVDIWQEIQDLVRSGAMLNTGSDGTASLTAFSTGQAALMVQSSRIYGDVKAAANFDFGVWPFPVSSSNGGAVPGGSSVWIIKEGHSDQELAAAASFGEFLASDAAQERIFAETGYLPTSLSALNSLSQSPATNAMQSVLLNQLENTPSTTASAGCHTGAMGQARPLVKSALEEIIGGGNPQTALRNAEEAGNKAIATYNERR
ncbi:extracellular solute-binding protein [Lysinibacter sp. HNR]|uniref:extracellular solute-binding protein n=1 Tax=Lysinibacter sp. HNR TaxID=3031408 RepID=UPI002434CDBA|nr:extracellular solute-binding protein [Lysinibacter sp. HNR]WGD37677.1 extracellular solute-binding protein [Lysinibacter sp. HNR]